MRRILGLFVLTAFVTVSCATTTLVTFDSAPQGADLYLDHEFIGETPLDHIVGNALWENPVVRLEKDGYDTKGGELDKEIKVWSLLVGIFAFFPALLWSWGPAEYQFYELRTER